MRYLLPALLLLVAACHRSADARLTDLRARIEGESLAASAYQDSLMRMDTVEWPAARAAKDTARMRRDSAVIERFMRGRDLAQERLTMARDDMKRFLLTVDRRDLPPLK